MKDTDGIWEQWGARAPYFGVLSDPRYRKPGLTKDDLGEFFLSGEEHIEAMLSTVRSRIESDFTPKRAVDFGCGTGRLVIPLARVCEEVVGLDVSESMLAEARRNCEAGALTNVRFVKSDDDLSGLSGTYDLVHSYIVFQHIPVGRGERLAAGLLKHLAPRGILALHFTYHRRASGFRKVIYWIRHNIPLAHNAANLLQGRDLSEPPMQMYTYNRERLLLMFQANGIRKIWCEPADHSCYLGVIFYGQKQG